ncbi:MAG: hypothetical protein K0U34_00435 [Alphaproteobacteria bacterium]|nr:hypothetical protein [Alphaproteobacteria bacterium]
MKRIGLMICGLTMAASAAFADDKVSEDEGKKIQAALAAWGCSGGEMEKESEGSGVFEVDDATCKGGQYDVKLNSNFAVTSISRD